MGGGNGVFGGHLWNIAFNIFFPPQNSTTLETDRKLSIYSLKVVYTLGFPIGVSFSVLIVYIFNDQVLALAMLITFQNFCIRSK